MKTEEAVELRPNTGGNMTATPFDRVLTPKQAEIISRVSRAVLRRWEREGRVRSIRTATGGHRRYLESEVIAAALGIPRERHTSW